MRFGKELNQALKILLVFAVITSIFSLMQKLSTVVVIGVNNDGFKKFMEVYLIWLIVMFFIIAGLCIYVRKADGKFSLTFINDPMIQLTSGLLIIFEGLFNLLTNVPVALSNIITFYQITSKFENTFGTPRETILVSNIFPSLINLLQVLFGLYFVLRKRRNKEIEHLD